MNEGRGSSWIYQSGRVYFNIVQYFGGWSRSTIRFRNSKTKVAIEIRMNILRTTCRDHTSRGIPFHYAKIGLYQFWFWCGFYCQNLSFIPTHTQFTCN
ncbi:hypothetical protein EG68_05564 [Paragonimus skrjabini miyazakii]|uniref:Uncharacterized protein n=1 Tax=Paragonimus skrjabini miyazakii TaxID=59628 RepID=A0A8S9Z0H2_9TREM|nr:hypothetical protein EG68_05564 [Paragonimus skrjabini miyazakii]